MFKGLEFDSPICRLYERVGRNEDSDRTKTTFTENFLLLLIQFYSTILFLKAQIMIYNHLKFLYPVL